MFIQLSKIWCWRKSTWGNWEAFNTRMDENIFVSKRHSCGGGIDGLNLARCKLNFCYDEKVSSEVLFLKKKKKATKKNFKWD